MLQTVQEIREFLRALNQQQQYKTNSDPPLFAFKGELTPLFNAFIFPHSLKFKHIRVFKHSSNVS